MKISFKKMIIIFITTIIITLGFLKLSPLEVIEYEGSSMTGTEMGSMIVGVAWIDSNISYDRYDYVIVRDDFDNTPKYIGKRIIGMSGDKLGVIDGRIYINGEMLVEDYVTSEKYYDHEIEIKDYIIPIGNSFILGDYRTKSYDSSEYGPIKNDIIVGKILIRKLPISILFDKLMHHINENK